MEEKRFYGFKVVKVQSKIVNVNVNVKFEGELEITKTARLRRIIVNYILNKFCFMKRCEGYGFIVFLWQESGEMASNYSTNIL